MSGETKMAFAHPLERSKATGGPLDRISLRDHIVEVEIGAFQAERGVTQRISFNIVVEVLPPDAQVEDDVDRILSYDKVSDAIAYELGQERLNLLETLAERVAERILLEPQAARVFVRIEKLDRGAGALGVEIVRSRHDRVLKDSLPEESLHPVLVYFSNRALASAHLSGWIDQLQARGLPVVLCVESLDAPRFLTGEDTTQHRVDLLSIAQNAWGLCARDARCVVVETRTELDWAMRNGQISVWAPSKIVLDALDGPALEAPIEEAGKGLSLAMWFAKTLQAQEVIVMGADLPRNSPLPLRQGDVTNSRI